MNLVSVSLPCIKRFKSFNGEMRLKEFEKKEEDV